MENKTDIRICIIGAGPAGMSALYHFVENEITPNIVCYEKQETWGGVWNYTWRTGLDNNNEHCHSSLYRDLWTNAPKEAIVEYPDYTFEKHFGKPLPSYPPAAAVRSYLEGRWTNGCSKNLRKYIKFNTIVRFVQFDGGKFTVVVDDRENNKTYNEIFTHVIVCSGIFNYPNQPEFPGIEHFEGRVLHSHNFRHGNEFKRQTVLVIGSHYSGEDIALHCLKYDATRVIVSWRTQPTGLTWPTGIEERPMVQRFDATTVYFKDGTDAEIDAVIFCTGFKNYFPFLENKLRIPEETSLYPDGLYRGSLFMNEGGKRLFYIGVQLQVYTMTYFDCIASWVCRYIKGELQNEPKKDEDMTADIEQWKSKLSKVATPEDAVTYQSELLSIIAKECSYTEDIVKAVPLIEAWLEHRRENIATFRCKQFTSIYTGTLAPKPQKAFMEAYDDSIEAYINC